MNTEQPGEEESAEECEESSANDESGQGAAGFGSTSAPEAQRKDGQAGQGSDEVHAKQPDEWVGLSGTLETPQISSGRLWVFEGSWGSWVSGVWVFLELKQPTTSL